MYYCIGSHWSVTVRVHADLFVLKQYKWEQRFWASIVSSSIQVLSTYSPYMRNKFTLIIIYQRIFICFPEQWPHEWISYSWCMKTIDVLDEYFWFLHFFVYFVMNYVSALLFKLKINVKFWPWLLYSQPFTNLKITCELLIFSKSLNGGFHYKDTNITLDTNIALIHFQ